MQGTAESRVRLFTRGTPLTVVVTALIGLITINAAHAVTIDVAGNPVAADFSGFNGSGFTPLPAAGELDSDDWRITGLSDGDMVFGGSYQIGDYARGASSGGTGTGGIYAFDVDNDAGVSPALGVQPIGTDFTPGAITWRLINNTGLSLLAMDIAYSVSIFNDQDRASSFNFAYSDDDANYTTLPNLDLVSGELRDTSPLWQRFDRGTTLSGLNIAHGGTFFLQWFSDDVSGSGSRDEFALDNVSVTGYTDVAAVPLPPAVWLLGSSLFAIMTMARRKSGTSHA